MSTFIEIVKQPGNFTGFGDMTTVLESMAKIFLVFGLATRKAYVIYKELISNHCLCLSVKLTAIIRFSWYEPKRFAVWGIFSRRLITTVRQPRIARDGYDQRNLAEKHEKNIFHCGRKSATKYGLEKNRNRRRADFYTETWRSVEYDLTKDDYGRESFHSQAQNAFMKNRRRGLPTYFYETRNLIVPLAP